MVLNFYFFENSYIFVVKLILQKWKKRRFHITDDCMSN